MFEIGGGKIPWFKGTWDPLDFTPPTPVVRDTSKCQALVSPPVCTDPSCPFKTWQRTCGDFERDSSLRMETLQKFERLRQIAMIIFGWNDYDHHNRPELLNSLQGGWPGFLRELKKVEDFKIAESQRLDAVMKTFDVRLSELFDHALEEEGKEYPWKHPPEETAYALTLVSPAFWHSSCGTSHVKDASALFSKDTHDQALQNRVGKFLRAGKFDGTSKVLSKRLYASHFEILASIVPAILPREFRYFNGIFDHIKEETIAFGGELGDVKFDKVFKVEMISPGKVADVRITRAGEVLADVGRPGFWSNLDARLKGDAVAQFSASTSNRRAVGRGGALIPQYTVEMTAPASYAAIKNAQKTLGRLKTAGAFALNYMAFLDCLGKVDSGDPVIAVRTFKEALGLASFAASLYRNTANEGLAKALTTVVEGSRVVGALVDGYVSGREAYKQALLSSTWDSRKLLVTGHTLRALGALVSLGLPVAGAAIFIGGTVLMGVSDEDPLLAWVKKTPFGIDPDEYWQNYNPGECLEELQKRIAIMEGTYVEEDKPSAGTPMPGEDTTPKQPAYVGSPDGGTPEPPSAGN